MREVLVVIAALLGLPGGALAHIVQPVQFPEIGSLRDVTHQTAFAIFQTYSTPQIHYNIVTDGGATCNGDVQVVARQATMTSGSPVLVVDLNTFAPGDVGKTIALSGFGAGGNTTLISTILTYTSATQVTLANNAQFSRTNYSLSFGFGADDAAAFKTFNTWALANQGSNQVVLTVPNGSSCWFGTQQSYSVNGTLFNAFASNIRNLIVEGTGATLNSAGGFGFTLGQRGVCQAGLASVSGCSARIQSASAGATQVVLTAASLSAGYISRFSSGNWIMIGGLNPQAIDNPNGSGFPPNPTFFEWREITNVNAGTGTITLDRPLTYPYLDTWPEYSAGNNNEADAGGPATIWKVGDSWNATMEYRGLTLTQTDALGSASQINANGRSVTYRNVTVSGGGQGGTIPSQNESWSAINTDYGSLTMEVDKLVGTMTMDGVNIRLLQFQSNSIARFVMSNSTVTLALQGGGRVSEITDSTLASFRPGSYAYGNSTRTVCVRCNVTSFDSGGGIAQGNTSDYTKVGSVLQFLNSAVTGAGPPSRIFSPVGVQNSNIRYMIGGSLAGSIGLLNASTITQDATDTYAQTGDAVAFPPPFTSSSGSSCCSTLTTHPAPEFTCDDCSGDPIFAAMNIQRGATPLAPIGEFASRDYAPSALNAAGSLYAWGRLSSLTINVTQAYTGSGSLTLNPTAQFNNFETVKQSDWTPFVWWPSINLKQTGIRVITPGGVTCDTGGGPAPGGCSGDTINSTNGYPPEAVWIKNGIGPYLSGTLSGGVNPQFTITIETDQGVVP